MINPYDIGRSVGSDLAKFLTEQNDIKKVIGIWAGRFQPYHPGHHSVFKALEKIVGSGNVYIGTSGKIEPGRSPLTFREKQKVISKMFGVPTSRIVKVKSPFRPVEILNKFDPNTTAVVTAFGAKDAGRLSAGSYYQKWQGKKNLEGYKDRGYFVVAPVFQLSVDGENVSGTAIRNYFGSSDISRREKAQMMKKLYGKVDQQVLDLFIKKFGNGLVQKEAIDPTPLTDPTLGVDGISVGVIAAKMAGKALAAAIPKVTTQAKKREPELKRLIYKVKDDPRFKKLVHLLSKEKNKQRLLKIGKSISHLLIPKLSHQEKEMLFSHIYTEEVLEEVMVSRVLIERFRERASKRLIKEGGAAGHMSHPFDDMDLTFGDLKSIIELGLQGQLNVEAPVTEKLDGQNISVSYRNDKGVIFARNKTHMKNQGANAPDARGIRNMFAGRGDLTDAFGLAADDLNSAISKLTPAQQRKIFADGKKWMSMEILYPKTQNVIPYGHNMLVFHNTFEVDDNGDVVGTGKGEGRMLAGMIKQINQNIQKTFAFSGPHVVTLPKSENYSKSKTKYFAELNKLQRQFRLTDNDSVMMWHQNWWEEFIRNQASKMSYNLPNQVLMGLLKRWAYDLKGEYSVRDIKREIQHDKFREWVLNFDKTGKDAQFKKNIAPFEKLFLQLGAEIMKNASGFLSAVPDDGAQRIKKDLDAAARELSRSNDVNKLSKFKDNMAKLRSIGVDNIVPSEGLVFVYRGKVYKLTGTFAPVNQLLGLLKF